MKTLAATLIALSVFAVGILAQEFKVIPNTPPNLTIPEDEIIKQYITHYQGRGRTSMEVMLYRTGMLGPLIRRIFREHGVPEEFAIISQVVRSGKGAVITLPGSQPAPELPTLQHPLWGGLVPTAGYGLALRRTKYLDETRSFEKATRAVAQHLKSLYLRYDDWPLALAAFYWSQEEVEKALKKSKARNYWAIHKYGGEMKAYVPATYAAIMIARDQAKYGFGHVKQAPKLQYDQIRMPKDTDLGRVAKAIDTSVEYLRYLNPELLTNSTPPEPYILRVPPGTATRLLAEINK